MSMVLQSTWCHLSGLIYWMTDSKIILKWSLADWPTGLMNNWLISWLTVTDWLSDWSSLTADCLYWLTDWSTNWLTNVTDKIADFLLTNSMIYLIVY